jgi:hypothetical protein
MNPALTKSSVDLIEDPAGSFEITNSRGVDATSSELSVQKDMHEIDYQGNDDDGQVKGNDNLDEARHTKESAKIIRRRQMGGAAVAGGVLGMVVAGPVGALGLEKLLASREMQ